MDVEGARVLALGRSRGDRTQRRAAEESHLDVLREAMDAEEPALALDAIEWRVPVIVRPLRFDVSQVGFEYTVSRRQCASIPMAA